MGSFTKHIIALNSGWTENLNYLSVLLSQASTSAQTHPCTTATTTALTLPPASSAPVAMVTASCPTTKRATMWTSARSRPACAARCARTPWARTCASALRLPPRTRWTQLQAKQQHQSLPDLQQPLLSAQPVDGRRGLLAHSAGPHQRGGAGLRSVDRRLYWIDVTRRVLERMFFTGRDERWWSMGFCMARAFRWTGSGGSCTGSTAFSTAWRCLSWTAGLWGS